MRLFLVVFYLFVALSDIALAAEGNKVSIGLLTGISFPSLSSGAFGYGFKAGYSVFPRLMVGLYYYRYGIGIQTSSGEASLIANTTNTIYSTEGMISFSDGFRAGLKLGLLSISPNVIAKDATTTIEFQNSELYLLVGPAVSYDHPIGHFSIGGELSYLYTLSGSAPKIINLLAVGKIHF